MLFRFTVSAFVGKNDRLGVVGSIPHLGNWDALSAIPLVPLIRPTTAFRPTCWTVVVDCGEESFKYKYVQWTKQGETISADPVCDTSTFESIRFVDVTPENEFRIPVPPTEIRTEYSVSPSEGDEVKWEGNGADDNREVIEWDEAVLGKLEDADLTTRVALTYPHMSKHFKDPSLNIVNETDCYVASMNLETKKIEYKVQKSAAVYCLQLVNYVHGMTEYCQTTHYYNSIKLAADMDWDKVLDRVYVGTCPRQLSHFQVLKRELGISAIINFQAAEDLPANWPDVESCGVESRNSSNFMKIVGEQDLQYVWLPTTDMCSNAKSQMVAHASWTLCGLLANPATTGVYVHCNAGVGRSSACVAAYMINCLKLSMRQANLLLNTRRPMAYFDGRALAIGAADYCKKFGQVANFMVKQPPTPKQTQSKHHSETTAPQLKQPNDPKQPNSKQPNEATATTAPQLKQPNDPKQPNSKQPNEATATTAPQLKQPDDPKQPNSKQPNEATATTAPQPAN